MSEFMDINAKFNIVRIPSPNTTITLDEILSDSNRGYYAKEQYFEEGQIVDHRQLLDDRLVAMDSERSRYVDNFDSKPKKWGDTRIVTIDGLQVFGSAGILVTPDNKIIKESADMLPRPSVHKHLIDAASILEGSKFAPAPQYLDCVAIVIPYAYGSFGHDLAQRFLAIGCFSGFSADMIYCRNETPFMKEVYNYLNIPNNMVLNPEPNHFLRFRRAHFLLRNDWHGPVPEIKKTFLNVLTDREGCSDVKPFRKVFYLRDIRSRALVSPRYIRNKDEIVKFLSDRGFEQIFWERLTISQKIKLIKEIKFSVEDMSSSVLYYSLFSKQCKLLNLYGPEFFDSYYFLDPSFYKNNVYGLLRGKNEQFAPGLSGVHASANFEVDLDELDFMISEVENKNFDESEL